MNVDKALDQFPGLSPFQWVCTVSCLLIRVNFALNWFIYTFVRLPTPYRCKSSNGTLLPSPVAAEDEDITLANFTTIAEEACKEDCLDYEFEIGQGNSLASEWALVCDQ